MPKRKPIAVLLTDEEREMLEYLMKAESRESMSNMIRWCIILEYRRLKSLEKESK